ncbi:hypothetical protein [Streptomyces sp. NPDC059761]
MSVGALRMCSGSSGNVLMASIVLVVVLTLTRKDAADREGFSRLAA